MDIYETCQNLLGWSKDERHAFGEFGVAMAMMSFEV